MKSIKTKKRLIRLSFPHKHHRTHLQNKGITLSTTFILQKQDVLDYVNEFMPEYSVESVHLNRSFCARVPRRCILTCHIEDGTIKMLLTVTEDKATLRSDLSTDYGDFKAESDAVRCRSFLLHYSLRKIIMR